MNPKECNRVDVLDLTQDLRSSTDEFWVVVRELIQKKGIDLGSIALCQFCENEDGIEYGLLVAKNYVVEYQHESYNRDEFILWRESVEPIHPYSDCQNEVNWTREMLANGEV